MGLLWINKSLLSVGEQVRPCWHHRSCGPGVQSECVRDVSQMSLFPDYFSGHRASDSGFFFPPGPFLTQNSICQALSPPWCIMKIDMILQKQQLIKIASMNSWVNLKGFKSQFRCFLDRKIYLLSLCVQLMSLCLFISNMAIITEPIYLMSMCRLNEWVDSTHTNALVLPTCLLILPLDFLFMEVKQTFSPCLSKLQLGSYTIITNTGNKKTTRAGFIFTGCLWFLSSMAYGFLSLLAILTKGKWKQGLLMTTNKYFVLYIFRNYTPAHTNNIILNVWITYFVLKYIFCTVKCIDNVKALKEDWTK